MLFASLLLDSFFQLYKTLSMSDYLKIIFHVIYTTQIPHASHNYSPLRTHFTCQTTWQNGLERSLERETFGVK
jgi:hypothetical protein